MEDVSVVSAGFDDVSREQLDKIKARTMYDMVEPIDAGSRKVLFLTNQQASLLAKEPASMSKMLDRLEVGEPQLVINIMTSTGFSNWYNAWEPGVFSHGKGSNRQSDWAAGCVTDRPPFLTGAASMAADGKIDTFMSEVIIPLAADTNAVVLCSAVPQECVLSSSFLRMVAVQRAKWGQMLPFTIISMSNSLHRMYGNPSLDAHWRDVSRKTRAWMLRDQRINQVYTDDPTNGGSGNLPARTFDLDHNATILIVVDNVDERKGLIDSAPFSSFLNELVRSLSSHLPSLALKTGFTYKNDDYCVCLAPVADSVQSGTPTILIDVRDRPVLSPTLDRAALIQEAKDKFKEHCGQYLQAGLNDNLDVCTFAYFHDVLTGDGSPLTTETTSRGGKNTQNTGTVTGQPNSQLPLHLAIARAKNDADSTDNAAVATGTTMRKATTAQINDTVDWIVDQYFLNAWELLNSEQQEAGGSYDKLYEEKIRLLRSHARAMLTSENLYHANLSDIEGSVRLVNKLVRLDRLPRENPLEGLLLLRSAWRDYDVAMALASRYKCWCKLIFVVQLLIGWLVVALSTASNFVFHDYFAYAFGSKTADYDAESVSNILLESSFAATLVLSIIISLDSLMGYKSKWKALRRGAGALQSAIWLYRTRVGPYAMEESPRKGAGRSERQLMTTLQNIRKNLISSAGLDKSNFHTNHKASTYKHFQDHGSPKVGGDDFHSPVQPDRYIAMRIQKNIAFYENRIPRYNRWTSVYKIMTVLLSAVAAALSRYKLAALVVAITSASTAITSWIEFADMPSKAQRYSLAVNALRNLLDWWRSLSEVQKASRDSIGELVTKSERVISEEQLGWMSVSKSRDEEAGGRGTDDNTGVAAESKRANSTQVHPQAE